MATPASSLPSSALGGGGVGPSAAAPAPASYASGDHVLSDKVSRALRVRTDTPAMRAALDALAGLSPDDDEFRSSSKGRGERGGGSGGGAGGGGGGGGGGVIDARSVRAAIERDALKRALEFEGELRRLAADASELRRRVDGVARVAASVGERVRDRILEEGDAAAGGGARGGAEEAGGGAAGGSGGAEDDPYASSLPAVEAATGADSSNSGDAWERERSLASLLASAQRSRVAACDRRRAVEAFLDKFDLGEDEARILDRYDFEGLVEGEYAEEEIDEMGEGEEGEGAARGSMDDANAFLDALERLAVIRKELAKAFGGGGEADSTEESLDYADPSEAGGARLGAHSALRMMDRLSSRQERAHERLYRFVQRFLGVGSGAPSPTDPSVPTSSADAVAGRSYSASDAATTAPGAPGRFRDPDEMDEAFHRPVIARSLRVLRHSRARRSHALELVAAGRRAEVTRRFLLALTSGYGGAAPLEMRAHDPAGYAGDMLAFAFRAFRVEGELVRTLLGGKGDGARGGGEEGGEEKEGGGDGKDAERDEDPDDDDDDDEYDREDEGKPMDVAEMLAQSMGGLARPLRTRLSQVVSSLATQGGDVDAADGSGEMGERSSMGGGRGSHDDDDDLASSSSGALNRLAALYSVCGLLRFYRSAVRKALDKVEGGGGGGGMDDRAGRSGGERPPRAENPLLTTCDECLADASEAYAASLRAYAAALGARALSSGSSECRLASEAVVRISEERAASPGFAVDEDEMDVPSRRLSLTFLIGVVVDAAMPRARTLDDCADLRKALGAAVKCGLDPDEASVRVAAAKDAEARLVEDLVDAEAGEVLRACGLDGPLEALRRFEGTCAEGAKMASHPGLSPKELEAATKKFYASLFAPPLPTFEDAARDPETRKVARSKTAGRVADAYRELHEAIVGERGGYVDLSFLGHDPDQVKTLLSL